MELQQQKYLELYTATGSAVLPCHYYQPATERSFPNDASHLPSNWQETPGSDKHCVKYTTSPKVLNPVNRKDFAMFTLRNGI